MLLRTVTATLALWLLAAAAPAAPPPAAYAHAIDEMAANQTAADRFSGVILVGKDGKAIYRHAFGLANRELGVVNTPAMRFRIGSITKQFTAAAILQLVEQGKVGLDDPISKYYPAAPAAWSQVTVKHLLTHSSGIPSYTNLPTFAAKLMRDPLKPEEVAALTQDKPLEFAPGARFNYDNTGYVLLGIVIEKASGQTYARYLQDRILGPAGLRDTGYDVAELVMANRAAGYERRGEGPVTNAAYIHMSLPYAAGSLYSTADDLLTWDVALRSGKVIRPESVKAMFTDYGFKYGFGQFLETREGRTYWSHGGGINGFVSMLGRYPDDGLTVVVLSNLVGSDPGHMADRAAELWFHPERGAGPAGAPTAAELDRYVGRYTFTDALTLDVTRDGGRLFAQSTGTARSELFRELGRSFFTAQPGTYFEFADGAKAPSVTMRRGGTTTTLSRAAP